MNRTHGLDRRTWPTRSKQAAAEVVAGRLDDQFPLVIWQTGSGTQSNMNVNEVIAGRANEVLTGTRGGKSPVHPERCMSTREPIVQRQLPDRAAFAAAHAPRLQRLLPGARPAASLRSMPRRPPGTDIVKIGRTHLQDATPLTLGQEFSGYANQLYRCRARSTPAVMHGMCAARRRAARRSAPGSTRRRVSARRSRRSSSELTGLPFFTAENKFEALAVERSDRPPVGHAQHAGGGADQDRQRYPPARLRPALGPRRARSAGERAGQLDHAGQGQPDPVRDADHGRGPGDGQSMPRSPSAGCRAIWSSTCSSR